MQYIYVNPAGICEHLQTAPYKAIITFIILTQLLTYKQGGKNLEIRTGMQKM